MIIVDSNIPMYLIGADDQLKAAADRAVRRGVAAGHTLVTDAEVYQEILHRYRAIRRDEAIDPCTTLLDGLTGHVFPIDRATIRLAISVLSHHPPLSARDALHIAVMRQHGIGHILSFDSGFDDVDGVERWS